MPLDQILERLAEAPVVPVVSVETADQAAPLAEALADGGITVAEMTLRTAAGLDAIRVMKQTRPDLVVGAGTVLSPADVSACERVGADFLVSPGADAGLLLSLASSSLPALPGVATPSEAMTARAAGLTHLKLFPAGVVGGAAMIKALSAPISDLHFMPTGGVTLDNLSDYLSLPNVYAVGGTWIAKSDHIRDGDWAGIADRGRQAVAAARAVRS